ncbi:MAG: hypothetical protein ACKVZH_09310 [Blastocatellia bacterium]
MPRTSRSVVCREGSEVHTLSNNFPAEGSWVYCCNCQTFIAWDKDILGVSLKECIFCLSSLNPRAYSCDHCAVTMVDYDDPTLRKHHGVLDWGAPQPACAGCHQFPASTPKKHFCQLLQCEIATARKTCSFCGATVQATSAANDGPVLRVAESTASAPSNDTAQFKAALIAAEAKARDAEDRRQLAEDAARKEIELRHQAELKAEEIEQRAAHKLNLAQAAAQESEEARREAEAAKLNAEAQARLQAERLAQIAELERQEAERKKADAENKAREVEIQARQIEEQRRIAEEAARRESEMRAQAESRVHEVAEAYSSRLAESQAQVEAVVKNAKKDYKTVALITGIAVALIAAFIMLISALLSRLR